MITKMNFISITGPKEDLDRMISTYLSHYEIQLESALAELSGTKGLTPFIESNPYKESAQLAEHLLSLTDGHCPDSLPDVTDGEAMAYLEQLDQSLEQAQTSKSSLEEKHKLILESISRIKPFIGLNYDVNEILHFHYIRFRFGRIPKEFWEKFQDYLYKDLSTIFIQCAEDEHYIWGVYFVPFAEKLKVDTIYSSLHFERTWIPDEYSGTPQEVCEKLQQELTSLEQQISAADQQISDLITKDKARLFASCYRVQDIHDNFDYRKMAACTKKRDRMYYILCGWMDAKSAQELVRETSDDEDVIILCEDDKSSSSSTPPTKLKNPSFFKPFELYTRMYGLPSYDEFDPTIFIALTYTVIFGAMFGDVGQGLCLLIGGFLLYRFKHIALAGIISCAGFFSTIFGFMFGSVFGFENVIEPLWLRPVTAMKTLPFIGKLNTVFVVAIAFGMFIILLTMVLNIISHFKNHEIGEALFDTNGIAGLVFYGSIVATIVLFMTGHTLPAFSVLIIMFLIPLIIIMFKEPLTRLLNKQKDLFPEGKGMFIIQGLFELIEVLLSYFSNTLSFVRIGAFAVSHAAMMEVVLMLAGAENGSSGNLVVIILGNLFVMGMEGLIVGIQVLRLEYYEMFSRFYKGDGREFIPYKKNHES